MFARKLAVSVVAIGSALVACSSPNPDAEEGLGVATAAVTNVPADVSCIAITVTGNRVAERKFDVSTGASSILAMTGLPVGAVTFVGNAYPTACSAVTSSSLPTWVSDPVSASLSAGVDAKVTLPLRRNGSSTVSVDFDDGPDSGTSTSLLAAAPTNASFGGVLLGTTSPITMITISNPGTAITGPIAAVLTSSQFALASNTCTVPLNPGASCALGVRFAPTVRGAASGSLNVTASPGGSLNIPLSGNGLAPAQLTITPTSRNYGSQPITTPSPAFTFIVNNTGDVPSGIPSVPTIIGPNAAEFDLVSHSCAGPIGPGASCNISVRFSPSTTGSMNANLTMNAVSGGTVSALLTGSGSLF